MILDGVNQNQDSDLESMSSSGIFAGERAQLCLRARRSGAVEVRFDVRCSPQATPRGAVMLKELALRVAGLLQCLGRARGGCGLAGWRHSGGAIQQRALPSVGELQLDAPRAAGVSGAA